MRRAAKYADAIVKTMNAKMEVEKIRLKIAFKKAVLLAFIFLKQSKARIDSAPDDSGASPNRAESVSRPVCNYRRPAPV